MTVPSAEPEDGAVSADGRAPEAEPGSSHDTAGKTASFWEGRRRRGVPGPRLVVGGIGVLTLLAVVGATLLVDVRLHASREAADTVTATWTQGRDRMAAARQLEAARTLARQVRHVPPGLAGGDARTAPMVKASVLMRDPALRLLLSPAARDGLDEAIAALETLAALRARPGRGEGPAIAWRLEALAGFAAAADAPRDPSRPSLVRALHTVLLRAARADGVALPVLERDARRLAARAIAAEPGGGPAPSPAPPSSAPHGSVLAAIEAALSIPALRAAEIAAADRAETLWRRVDEALAGLADQVLAEGDDRLMTAVERQRARLDRLADGLLAVLLAAVALGLAGFALAWASAVAPLARLGRWADRLDIGGASGEGAGSEATIATALATMEDLQIRAARAEATARAMRADAGVLRVALLGAAPEAALGRALTTVAQELQTLLGDVRAHAALARHECETLLPADHHQTRGRGPRPLPPHQDRTARVIVEACAALRDQCDVAAHLVGALRGLAGAEDRPRRSIDLTRALEETLSVLAPRLRPFGASVRLSCNESVVVRGDPVALGAVLFYVVEGAVLRAEGAMAGPRPDASGGEARRVIAAADRDQGRFAFNGSGTAAAPARPSGGGPRLNGVSVAAVLESGGRVRLTIADDGPAPGAAVRGLMRDLDPSRPGGGDDTLVPALRDAPEAAALVLADALARAGLGCGLDVLAGEDWGLTVRLYLPLHAREDDG